MRRSLFYISFLFFIFQASSQIMWQFNKDTVITWYYQEGDEFNGNTVNTDYWNYSGSVRSIVTNKEQQYYTDGENHLVKDGVLALNATKKNVEKKLIDWKLETDSIIEQKTFYGLNKRTFNYTAGYLETNKAFVYGYFEIKFKSPSTKGFWPAFWLYGGNPGEEIDMMELKTEKRNQIHVGRHSTKKEENYLRYRLRKRVWGAWVKFKGDFSSGFNVVSGEWTEGHIRFYLNGECMAHTNLHFEKAKKLILNIAVPSNGPFKPGPLDTVTQSGSFETDYVRIWSRSAAAPQVKRKHQDENQPQVRPITTTTLKSRDKFIYGTKKDHANDGISVSLFQIAENKIQLTVLGKTIPPETKYSIKDKSSNVLSSSVLSYGETILDLEPYHSSAYAIEVEVNGRFSKYELNP